MLSPAWPTPIEEQGGLGRSPTFVVGSDKQRRIMEAMRRRDQQISEHIIKSKPLCFNGATYQRTHPRKLRLGHKDADAALVSPMMLGVADGVSQIEEYGIDASELPRELLKACEDLATSRLIPDVENSKDSYFGPISLMCEAYEATDSQGSTTVLLAVLDNSTKIHGKLHPMVAMISIGDCELVILRRIKGRKSELEAIFHTEMQRIDGNTQSPLQVARVPDEVDPGFDESIAIDVIRHGSAVHCVSAYEGDILVMGSDGVFDNLYQDEIVDICNHLLPPISGKAGPQQPLEASLLKEVAQSIVDGSHAKTVADALGRYACSPIGRGGKVDDTCCVVGEVVEWTKARTEAWDAHVQMRRWDQVLSCGGTCARPKPNYDQPGHTLASEDNKDPLESLGCCVM